MWRGRPVGGTAVARAFGVGVERVACKPSSVPPAGHPLGGDGHSSGRRIAAPLERYTRGTRTGPPWVRGPLARPARPAPLSILLQVGFTGPPCHHGAPVSSYLTLSPSPPGAPTRVDTGRRTPLCGTFPGVTPAGRYPAPRPCGARTFLPRPSRATSDHPVHSLYGRARISPDPHRQAASRSSPSHATATARC